MNNKCFKAVCTFLVSSFSVNIDYLLLEAKDNCWPTRSQDQSGLQLSLTLISKTITAVYASLCFSL